MHVILLRHATRDVQPIDDGGLSPHGHKQAEELINQLAPNGPLPEPSVLMVSPKRRARETLHPVAHHLSVPVVVTGALDERLSKETGQEFEARIQEWFRRVENDFAHDDVIWSCSHADWLEAVLQMIPGDLTDWERMTPFSPAQFMIFEVVEGKWRKLGAGKV